MAQKNEANNYRVLEFRPRFTKEQVDFLDRCLEPMRQLWNAAIAELELFDEMTYWDKQSRTMAPCSPVQWSTKIYFIQDGILLDEVTQPQKNQAINVQGWRDSDAGIEYFSSGKILTAKETEGKVLRYFAPCSTILAPVSYWLTQNTPSVTNYTTVEGWHKAGKGVFTVSNLSHVRGWDSEKGLSFYSCPVRFYREPYFQSTKYTGKNSISKLASQQVLRSLIATHGINPFILQVPSDFLYGLIKSLSTAWNEYSKHRYGKGDASVARGKPRRKKLREGLKTLESGRSKTAQIKGKDLISLPILGKLQVDGLSHRWNAPEINTFCLTKKVEGYYLQLTGNLPKKSTRQIQTNKVSAIDPGIRNYLSFDDGRKVENPRYYERSETKLAKLQQTLCHKLTHTLVLWLNHPSRKPEDLIQHCPHLTISRAQAAINAKSEAEIVAAIGMSYFGKLKYSVGSSNRTKAIERKISRLHEKIRNQRKHFIHKQTTWHARTHEVLICEDGMQSPLLKARLKSSVNSDRTGFDKTGAEQKTELNKKLSDTGYGAYLSLLDQKTAAMGRKVIKHPSKHTTEQCPICDSYVEMPLGKNWYDCPRCGYECDRDQKAALLMIVKVFEQGAVEWDALSKPAQSVIKRRQAYKERCLSDVQDESIEQKPKRATRKRRSA